VVSIIHELAKPAMSATARSAILAATVVVAVLTGLLPGCGAAPVRLEPPRISLVELDLGEGLAVLRIDNGVAAPMPADRAEVELVVGGRELGRFTPTLGLTIPGLSSERVDVRLNSSPDAIRPLFEQRERVDYVIAGTLWLDDGRTLPIDSSGWLSPTPGKPGSFR
jgi:hypothetical protein